MTTSDRWSTEHLWENHTCVMHTWSQAGTASSSTALTPPCQQRVWRWVEGTTPLSTSSQQQLNISHPVSNICTSRCPGKGSVIFFFYTLHLFLAGNSGRLTWIRLQQPQEQRYPLLTVRAVFSCCACLWLAFLTCAQMRCKRGLSRHHKTVKISN